jgi:hypothetical protein
MQVVIAGTSIPCITNVGNGLTLARKLPRVKLIRVALKVSVVKDQLLVSAELVDGCAPTLALEESNNLAVGRGEDWSSRGGRNIYGVMHAPFRARIGEGVMQLVWLHSGDWNDQFQFPDEAAGDRWDIWGVPTFWQKRRVNIWTNL